MSTPVRLACGAVLVAAIAPASCAAARARAPVETSDGVRFTLSNAEAMSVAVAGTFNDWSAVAHPLTRAGARLWTAVVTLAPGEHQFMFIVNGTEWVTPPMAEDYVDDGFGSRNGVVVVRPRER